MLFIETDHLKPGMRLAKPIYNKVGVMLYDRDTRLTEKGIQSIRNFNLIGIYILEPAEPLPPLSDEDIELEQFLTVSMFKIQDIMDSLMNNKETNELNKLAQDIIRHYGSLDHKMNFLQPLRSGTDYVYKHANSVAILTALLSHALKISYADQVRFVTAALIYDIGYLYANTDMMQKLEGSALADDLLKQAIDKGVSKLKEPSNRAQIPNESLIIVSQMAVYNRNPKETQSASIRLAKGSQILLVADAYDSLTAMRWGSKPISELAAIRYLQKYPKVYPEEVVDALIASVYLLPRGCCVDLSHREKGLVLEDNPVNPLEPLILNFADNRIYDLSDPTVNSKHQIVDIMKTMDNRIQIDADILKKFHADEHITKTAERYRKSKQKLYEVEQKRKEEEAREKELREKESLEKERQRQISNEPIIAKPLAPEDALAPTEPVPARPKRPRKKLI